MIILVVYTHSDTEEGAPKVGDAEGEGEDTPAAAKAGDNIIEEDSPFRDSDEEEASPPTKKQKLDEGTLFYYKTNSCHNKIGMSSTLMCWFPMHTHTHVAEEIDSGSEGGEAGEGGEELSELQQEVADLEELEEGPTDTTEVTVGRVNLGEEEEEGSEDEVEDRK